MNHAHTNVKIGKEIGKKTIITHLEGIVAYLTPFLRA